MTNLRLRVSIAATMLLITCTLAESQAQPQRNDANYSAKIKEFTTEKFFLTELVDHVPASDSIPTPEKFLGHIAGAPGFLTYTKDLHAYYRALAAATPRVKVFIAPEKSEEGKEQLLVLVSDEANLANLDHFKSLTARLSDPRKTTDSEAEQIVREAKPFYWASGSIHSTETGSPEMLMELAYRLAVEDTPYIRNIRKNVIVMITPALEVDGRDRMVDTNNYHKANPGKGMLNLLYWGHYVAHDNNRDSMGMALALSRNQMRTFFEYHPQVLHDLHESIPFLYISTGTGPYNAWLDPITIDEWHQMAYHEVGEMTRRGVVGVWTHGFYDGWAPNYMFYVANGHNSIGRFYETFGSSVADTLERTVTGATQRAWYRSNPPLSKVKWSLRNNVNLQESGLLLGLGNVADNKERFLMNFYTKGKRAIAKATTEGPTAYVIPGDNGRPTEAADMVNSLRDLGVEVHRLDKAYAVQGESGKGEAGEKKASEAGENKDDAEKPSTSTRTSTSTKSNLVTVTYPAGSYVIRMDQPYSRLADMLLDLQFYSSSDPRPYDDTGWTVGLLRNVKTVRITEKLILETPMTMLSETARVAGKIGGASKPACYVLNHTAENGLAVLRFKLKDLKIDAAEESFNDGDRSFNAGSFLIKAEDGVRDKLEPALKELGLTAIGVEQPPTVKAHPLRAPRIVFVHTWTETQNEGWFRYELDRLQIPYHYVSIHALRDDANLRRKYDVILFPPVFDSTQGLINGIPMRGDPIPWKGSKLTPNIGLSPDQTDDIRGGMGLSGVANLRRFVEEGGLFIPIQGVGRLPIDMGMLNDVSVDESRTLVTAGSIFNSRFVDRKSPIAYGYGETLPIYFSQSPLFKIAKIPSGEEEEEPAPGKKPSGRGTQSDLDVIQGRPLPPEKPKKDKSKEDKPKDEYEGLTDYAKLFLGPYLTPRELRPRVILRFAKEEKYLLASGMLAGGSELADRPAVIDAPLGKGHVLLFATNPMWRHTTQGEFFLLFNAFLNWDHLDVGREVGSAGGTRRAGKAEE